jgi:hypothetical protein
MYIKRALGAVLTKSPECRTYEKLTREELEEDKDLQLVQRRQVSLGPKGRVLQVPKGLLSDALKAPIPIYMTLKDSRDDHVLQQDALKSLCIKEMEQMRAFDALMVQCSKEFIHLSQHHLEMVTRLQDVNFSKGVMMVSFWHSLHCIYRMVCRHQEIQKEESICRELTSTRQILSNTEMESVASAQCSAGLQNEVANLNQVNRSLFKRMQELKRALTQEKAETLLVSSTVLIAPLPGWHVAYCI